VVDQPIDGWIDYALTQAAHHLKRYWVDAFKRGELTFAKPAHLAAVLSKIGGKNVLELLKGLVASDEVEAKARNRAIASIVAVGGPEELNDYALKPEVFTRAGVYDAGSHAEVLDAVIESTSDRGIRPQGDPSATLNRLIDHRHDGLKVRALTLAGLWKVNEIETRIAAAANDGDASLVVRAAAFRAMAEMQLEPAPALLGGFAKPPHDPRLRSAAIEALCVLDIDSAAKHAVALFSDHAGTPRTAASVIEAFLSRKGGGAVLAAALRSAKTPPSRADQLLHAFFETGRAHDTLVVALRELAGASGEVPEYSEDYVKKLVAEARIEGATERGAKANAACLACHKIGNTSGVTGPDLTTVGTTLSAERITEELLWPNRQVKEGYTLLQVLTNRGMLLQGYERRTKERQESGDLVMRRLAEESLVTVRKDRIASKTVIGSAMPTGLTAAMTRREVLDLIRYLSELGSSDAE